MHSRPNHFKYDALPSPSSIRLVTILPRDDGEGTAICDSPVLNCRLETVDLNDAPVYDALSYTWGSPWWPQSGHEKVPEYSLDNTYPISINGALKMVTKNLYEGLLRLRHHAFDAEEEEEVEGEGGLWFQRDPFGDANHRLYQFHKTPLIQAAKHGHRVAVRQFLQKGADIHAQDSSGHSALHYAAENGHLSCVKLLVWAGSNRELRDKRNRTPLDCCEQRRRGDFEQVATFLKAPTTKDQEAKSRPLRIWIDALCINQDDAPERMAQVEMMKLIYASAQSTIVWLGVEDQWTEFAAQALDILLYFPHLVGLGTVGHSASDLLREAREAAYFEQIKQRFQALMHLVKRSWFSRIWVIQETLLAKNVTVLCGKYILPWKGILMRGEHAIPVIDKGEAGLKFLIERDDSPEFLGQVAQVYGNIEFFNVALEKSSLASLLIRTENFSAKDPRDKFFALLSLARKRTSDNVMAVDYQTPPRDFFVSKAYDLMSCKGIFSGDARYRSSPFQVLEGLSFCCWPPRSQDNQLSLPSWVPDFRRTWYAKRRRLFQRSFAACTSVPAEIRELPQKDRLGLVGFKFDEIEAVATGLDQPSCRPGSCHYMLFWPSCHCEARWKKSLPLWLQFASSLDSSQLSSGSLLEALLHSLTGGMFDCQGFGLNNATKRKLVEGLKTLVDAESLELFRPLIGAINKEASSEMPRSERPAFWDFEEQLLWMQRYCSRRSLYKTRQGYLGLGRNEVEPGDEVWLFAGARTPFVVKRLEPDDCENVLEFRGETYIHGIMHGEAVEGREGDMTELELA